METGGPELAGWIVGAVVSLAALVAAAGYLISRVRDWVHILDRILSLVETSTEVVERELEINTGGSIKDDVSAIAHTVGNLWRRVEDMEANLTAHLTEQDTTATDRDTTTRKHRGSYRG